MRSNPKVLLVDDEPHVRTYLRLVLREAFGPTEVLEAAERDEAMRHFGAGLPDLVLLDINLVGASGLDVLREIRALDENVPVVLMTAVNIRHTVEEALAAGANAYLLKDQPQDELIAALRETLPGRGTEEAAR